MAKVIKEIHPEDIVLYKVGTFYNTYGKDSYIIVNQRNKIKKQPKDQKHLLEMRILKI